MTQDPTYGLSPEEKAALIEVRKGPFSTVELAPELVKRLMDRGMIFGNVEYKLTDKGEEALRQARA